MQDLMRFLLGSQSREAFIAKTRVALLETLTVYVISKNISQNNDIEFYLPRLVECMATMLECERCAIYLYDRANDEIYCKVITGK